MKHIMKICLMLFALIAVLALLAGPASAADTLKGQVLVGKAPLANSTVTL